MTPSRSVPAWSSGAVPHLTIADRAALDEMQAAERSVQEALPIQATVRAVTLLVEQPSGEWESAASFPLGVARPERASLQ